MLHLSQPMIIFHCQIMYVVSVDLTMICKSWFLIKRKSWLKSLKISIFLKVHWKNIIAVRKSFSCKCSEICAVWVYRKQFLRLAVSRLIPRVLTWRSWMTAAKTAVTILFHCRWTSTYPPLRTHIPSWLNWFITWYVFHKGASSKVWFSL